MFIAASLGLRELSVLVDSCLSSLKSILICDPGESLMGTSWELDLRLPSKTVQGWGMSGLNS